MIQVSDKYAPLWTSPSRYFFVTGGRGSGKSFANGLFIENLTWEESQVIMYTRYTLTSAYISVIPEYYEKMEIRETQDYFKVTKHTIQNMHSRSLIYFVGIKTSQGNQTANLKSVKNPTCWINDEADEIPDFDTFDKIDNSVRTIGAQNKIITIFNPPHKSHWLHEQFFKDVPPGFNGTIEDRTYIHTTYLDNLANLDKSFVDKAERVKKENPGRYNHVYLGHWANDIAGALWTYNMINKCRIQEEFNFSYSRKLVSIDPAVTSKITSDETGIIVCGRTPDDFGHVIDDYSGRYTPQQWASKAVALYYQHEADAIVAEVNQGGDMVEEIIRNIDSNIRVIKVISIPVWFD